MLEVPKDRKYNNLKFRKVKRRMILSNLLMGEKIMAI